MNRNTESRFALNPSITIGRSKFKRDSSIKTSFNVGDVVPFYLDEVLPGDEFKVKTSKVVRMPMFQTAPMDNLYLDTYYFFIPMRLCWSHAKEFFGENTESAWVPTTTYSIPKITSPSGGWNVGTIADYLGVPTGVSNLSINALPFRAYALVMDQWFRSTVVDDPLSIPVDDSTVTGTNGTNYITDTAKGGKPFVANKYFDYFTGCLPAPQRGNDVLIPIGSTTSSFTFGGSAAVTGNGYGLGLTSNSTDVMTTYGSLGNSSGSSSYLGYTKFNGEPVFDYVGTAHPVESLGVHVTLGVPTKTQLGDHPEYSGLVVSDFSGVTLSGGTNISVGSINQLRIAFQMQKWYEKLAMGGDRYISIIKSMFGVTSPDARLQRTEYLGGNRLPITIHQVIQQSGTASGTTPQGTPTGQSLTTDTHFDFDRSFTEHGYVLGVQVARYDHSFQQGLDRLWTRSDKFDFYWPVFSSLGNMAVRNDQIYAQGSGVVNPVTNKPYDQEVFGYQEAWADYRYKTSKITGQMRSSYSSSLDVWHFADDYNALPTLSSSWLKEDKSNVDRTLVVGTDVNANQLFADIYVENTSIRPMPMYSIPGLIDHH